ncbi:MAG TPA: 2-amino-4-hydroxy-6-hydroxymethyldihydropteridine diphosphokinase [Patescibacteria group bacterium]
MHTVYLALGANTGNKKENMAKAIALLGEKVRVVKKAPLYETKPWGYTEQENFLNSAILIETELSPKELLAFIKQVEEKVGRQKRFTNGPREIDIDILFYDDLIINTPSLTIPHALLHVRDFVLQPLCDIAPDFVHPILHKTIRQLLQEVPETEKVVIKKAE